MNVFSSYIKGNRWSRIARFCSWAKWKLSSAKSLLVDSLTRACINTQTISLGSMERILFSCRCSRKTYIDSNLAATNLIFRWPILLDYSRPWDEKDCMELGLAHAKGKNGITTLKQTKWVKLQLRFIKDCLWMWSNSKELDLFTLLIWIERQGSINWFLKVLIVYSWVPRLSD